MAFLDDLPEYGAAPAQSNGAASFGSLPEYTGQTQQGGGYRYNVLPLYQDERGQFSPAVPGIIDRTLRSAISGFAAPEAAYSGTMPVTQQGLNGPETTPEAMSRARDFATTFGAIPSPASRAGEIALGPFASQRVPTASELKSTGAGALEAATASPTMAPSDAIENMARSTQAALNGEGLIAKRAPGTHGLLDELANPPADTAYTLRSGATYPGLSAARDDLSTIAGELKNGRPTPDAKAATAAIQSLDNLINQHFPNVADARANYAAAMRTNPITGEFSRGNTGILEQAEASNAAAHSGLNLDNNIRQRVKNFLQSPANLRGYTAEEEAALNQAVQGGPLQNTARFVSKYFGGGGGLGGLVAGGVLGHFLGNPELGAMAGMGIGRGAGSLADYLAMRSLNPVDQMLRMRSPLYEQMQTQGLLSPSTGANEALMRGLLPSILAAPQQPQTGIIPWAQQLYDAGGA